MAIEGRRDVAINEEERDGTTGKPLIKEGKEAPTIKPLNEVRKEVPASKPLIKEEKQNPKIKTISDLKPAIGQAKLAPNAKGEKTGL